MTKSHVLSYLGVVIAITIAAYVYTSIADAPVAPLGDELNSAATSSLSSGIVLDEEVKAAEDSPTPLPTTALVDTSWQWVHTEDSAGIVTFVPKSAQMFVVSFDEAGRMSSQTDCNSLGGTYEINGDSLTFGPLMSTLMYCEGSDEAVYGAQLAKVVSYTQSATTLTLMLDDAAGVMIFTAVAIPQ